MNSGSKFKEGQADLEVDNAEDKVGKGGGDFINVSFIVTDSAGTTGKMFGNLYFGNIKEALDSMGLSKLAEEDEVPAYKLIGASCKAIIGPGEKGYFEPKKYLPRAPDAPPAIVGSLPKNVSAEDDLPF
jgi:hypothetical protein